ncbi:murein transglycosylase A [Flexibacterium corallicola]|uniref:murein transglycosylase A n=1 Tax=Flexibacterium corallicola TaxID=3037259 RepID=UPI00286F6D16|nr:MltA domain-containing protein [Pseudovibrio sp. M1P-2-3]
MIGQPVHRLPKFLVNLLFIVCLAQVLLAANSKAFAKETFVPISYLEIPNWAAEDHSAAFSVFSKHCQRLLELPDKGFHIVCKKALEMDQAETKSFRDFFERHFQAYKISKNGFITGYYQPEVDASLHQTDQYNIPLYRFPKGVKNLPDRQAVMEGALSNKGLELVWLKDPVEAFFIAIQGSALLRMQDKSLYSLRYAGKSGHPYTPIGRILIEKGDISRDKMSMQAIKSWLNAHPEQIDDILTQNKSYIFFDLIKIERKNSAPIGGAGLPLKAGYSLAVDLNFHGYGTPIFLSGSNVPVTQQSAPFARLLIAQDTGSAIIGAARGDLYVGTGKSAGALAGQLQHRVQFFSLLPKANEIALERKQ